MCWTSPSELGFVSHWPPHKSSVLLGTASDQNYSHAPETFFLHMHAHLSYHNEAVHSANEGVIWCSEIWMSRWWRQEGQLATNAPVLWRKKSHVWSIKCGNVHTLEWRVFCQDSSLDAVFVRSSVGRTYRCKRVVIALPPRQARTFMSSSRGSEYQHFLS